MGYRGYAQVLAEDGSADPSCAVVIDYPNFMSVAVDPLKPRFAFASYKMLVP